MAPSLWNGLRNRYRIRLNRVFRRMEQPFSGDPDRLSILILKVLSVIGPGFFIWALESVRHSVFSDSFAAIQVNMGVALVATGGAFIFSQVVFGEIERIQREVVRRNEELTVLNTVASAVNQSLSLDVVLERALEKVLQATKADTAAIFLIDKKSNQLFRTAYAGDRIEEFDKVTVGMGEGIIGQAALTGRTELVSVDRGFDIFRREAHDTPLYRIAGVPLKSNGTTIGVFGLATQNHKSFSQEDVQLLANTGTHIAVAIENARLHEQVQAAAAIEERERIAREMHDGVAQVLSYIIVKTQTLKGYLSEGNLAATRAQLQELEDTSQEAYAEVRESILGLRLTTEHKSLVSAIQEFIVRYNQSGGTQAMLQANETEMPVLSPAAEVQVIRIIQEALTNTRKHAKAQHAWVNILSRDLMVEVSIVDDGEGFNVNNPTKSDWPRFGLQTMKERAESINGTLTLHSSPGKGTRVEVMVPARGVH